jgi:hypothetical protein
MRRVSGTVQRLEERTRFVEDLVRLDEAEQAARAAIVKVEAVLAAQSVADGPRVAKEGVAAFELNGLQTHLEGLVRP